MRGGTDQLQAPPHGLGVGLYPLAAKFPVQVVEEQVLPKFVRVFLQDKPDKGPDGVDMQ